MSKPSSSRERLCLYTALIALSAMSIDGLLPALRAIEAGIGSSDHLSTRSVVSLFILGMVFGEFAFGPIADALGRKSALAIGLTIYALGTLCGLLANSLEMLVFGRLMQGVGAAGPKIAIQAMIRDQFESDRMARILSVIFSLMVVVPIFAPVLGQMTMQLWGWRSLFAAYLSLALLLGAWFFVRHPETLPHARRTPIRPAIVWANVRRVAGNTRVAAMTLASGFVFGAELVYLSTAPAFFYDVYGIDREFPFYFAGLAGGIALACFVNGQLVERFGMVRMTRFALALLIASSAALWFVVSVNAGRPPLWTFLPAVSAPFFCLGLLFGNLNALAMVSLGKLAGLGASLIASGSSIVAVAYGVAIGSFYDGTLFALAAAFLITALAACVLAEIGMRADASPLPPLSGLSDDCGCVEPR